uniref:Glucose-induced degradation protein 4 homolog n=1 Tax=Timspurckia oligopyrenoides TaxID=708627 RepID=A0A7S0ZAR5_9RHOD|mmetsp:Transcript_1046/g.1984  ORF Transcript_1046/g.1984 Transcript_1046/m.1984 type:complete len:238 (+) Transcript_1046:182-895(+)
MPGFGDNHCSEEYASNNSLSSDWAPLSSFLHVGQAFCGIQNVTLDSSTTSNSNTSSQSYQNYREALSNSNNHNVSDSWRINVRIQGVDLERGTLCGSMEALDVPKIDTPVLTFWEGEIVDNKNSTFRTRRWDATKSNDIEHWSKFESFAPYSKDLGASQNLGQCRHVFMRWKEKFFERNDPNGGLTIAGFYYLCLDRQTGKIYGYYYDPRSAPFQKLELFPYREDRAGYAFASYEFR